MNITASTTEEISTTIGTSVARLYRRLRLEKDSGQLGDTASSVLSRLARSGPTGLKELSHAEHISAPSMNQTVNTLIDRGLIVRLEDPADGRKVIFEVTPFGLHTTLERKRRWQQWLDKQVQSLSLDERQLLLKASEILERMADA